jgi:hypothetical protein
MTRSTFFIVTLAGFGLILLLSFAGAAPEEAIHLGSKVRTGVGVATIVAGSMIVGAVMGALAARAV